MLFYLLQGITLGLSAAATPGPFQAFLLSQSARIGWRRSLPAACAPLLSDGPIIVLVMLILTSMPGWFLEMLRFGGGLFLVGRVEIEIDAAQRPLVVGLAEDDRDESVQGDALSLGLGASAERRDQNRACEQSFPRAIGHVHLAWQEELGATSDIVAALV